MKQILLLSLSAALCLLSACGAQPEAPEPMEFPEAPPELTVTAGEASCTALRGGWSWTVREGNDQYSGTISDNVHPLECREMTPQLTAAESQALLSFPLEPDALTAQCWPESSWGDVSAQGEEIRQLKSESCVFEASKTCTRCFQCIGLIDQKTPGELTAAETARLLEYKTQGYNIARSAHDPLLPEVLAAADEQGFMIYHEWAWSFLHNLRFREFEANNRAELKEFVDYSHNHPSVVMWSLGNEINHRNPEVNRLLNQQAETVRREDLQKRPLCSFSGSGAWNTYGPAKLETDFFDVHNYCGIGSPWTTFREKIEEVRQGLWKIYGDGKLAEAPFCAWELIGFSWGRNLTGASGAATSATTPPTWGKPLPGASRTESASSAPCRCSRRCRRDSPAGRRDITPIAFWN